MSITQLRKRVPAFIAALEEDWYRAETGQIPWPPLALRYSSAGDLFSLARITEVQRVLAGAAGEDERRARALLEFVARGHAWSVSAEAMEERLEWEATGAIEGDDFSLTPVGLQHALGSTPDRDRRRRLEQALLEELDDRRYLAEEVVARHREGLAELGYGSVLETLEILGGLDLRAIAREAEAFLADTQDLFDELLAWYLPRLTGSSPAEATFGDLVRLERAAVADDHLHGGPGYDVFFDALLGIGLDPTAEGRNQIERVDARRLIGGVSRAPQVPDRVRLAFSAGAGRRSWTGFLQALGTSLHQAYTDPTLPVEERLLGDEAVPNASGVLFALLVGSAAFGSRILRLSREVARETGRLEALLRLVALRRDAAVLGYGLAVHLDAADADDYTERLGRATGVRHDARLAIWAIEPELSAARRIRGAQLGAIHAELLRNRYDEDWFRNPAAGGYLRDLFSYGRRYTAQEIAVQLGTSGLGYASWVAAVRELARDA